MCVENTPKIEYVIVKYVNITEMSSLPACSISRRYKAELSSTVQRAGQCLGDGDPCITQKRADKERYNNEVSHLCTVVQLYPILNVCSMIHLRDHQCFLQGDI